MIKSKKYMKFIVEAEKNVAFDSPDHQHPLGSARDNSVNKRFNEKLYTIFKSYTRPLKVLDLGCSGGGFVKCCIDDGCIAIGLEGSDYSKILGRAEWKIIPDKLFVCDITAPFVVKIETDGNVSNLKFDVITSWEVMEHIQENDIRNVAENIKELLLPHGLWIMSVSLVDDYYEGVNLHQTVKPKKWWIEKFGKMGLVHLERFENYFNNQYIRGNRYGANNSFHLVLSHTPQQAPINPKYSLRAKLYDFWRGSDIHRLCSKILEL